MFPPTRWTLVLAARGRPEERRRALEELIAPRWRALYVLARKRGLASAEAEDAVQSFLARVVEGDLLARVDPARGRLRTFLRAAFHNHLLNLHEHEAAARRGGAHKAVDIEAVETLVASPAPSAEAAFDRAWALATFDAALGALERELDGGAGGGRSAMLRELFHFGETAPYGELAPRLGMSVPQLKSFVHRAKGRFRQLLRAEVADTLDAGEDADAELSVLMGLLSP